MFRNEFTELYLVLEIIFRYTEYTFTNILLPFFFEWLTESTILLLTIKRKNAQKIIFSITIKYVHHFAREIENIANINAYNPLSVLTNTPGHAADLSPDITAAYKKVFWNYCKSLGKVSRKNDLSFSGQMQLMLYNDIQKRMLRNPLIMSRSTKDLTYV